MGGCGSGEAAAGRKVEAVVSDGDDDHAGSSRGDAIVELQGDKMMAHGGLGSGYSRERGRRGN